MSADQEKSRRRPQTITTPKKRVCWTCVRILALAIDAWRGTRVDGEIAGLFFLGTVMATFFVLSLVAAWRRSEVHATAPALVLTTMVETSSVVPSPAPKVSEEWRKGIALVPPSMKAGVLRLLPAARIGLPTVQRRRHCRPSWCIIMHISACECYSWHEPNIQSARIQR